MKASPEMDAVAAFPDPKQRPDDSALPAALGPAFGAVGDILTRLRTLHPEVTSVWQFSSRTGWYQVQLLGKRRLIYLIPRLHDFQLTIILGGQALSTLRSGPFAARLARCLRTARRYPEGTAFTFEHATIDADLFTAFIEAKIPPVALGRKNAVQPVSARHVHR